MNCQHCSMEIRQVDVPYESPAPGLSPTYQVWVEFESGEEHIAQRCRDALSRERKETRQTFRDILAIIGFWRSGLIGADQAFADIETQLEIDQEMKQTLLSVKDPA